MKFKGTIKIPPKQLLFISICIKHLYKSFVLYLSYKYLSFDLFLAKYGGFVNINDLSRFIGGSNIVSCLIIRR